MQLSLGRESQVGTLHPELLSEATPLTTSAAPSEEECQNGQAWLLGRGLQRENLACWHPQWDGSSLKMEMRVRSEQPGKKTKQIKHVVHCRWTSQVDTFRPRV